MKMYMVFLALLIVNVGFMGFNQDMGRYLMLQNIFKDTSEECAAQAALLLNEEDYFQGRIVFLKDDHDSKKALESVCQKIGIRDGYTLTLNYEDDSTSYAVSNSENNPRITATVMVNASSLFQTKLFDETIITRTSCYEIL